MSGLVVQAKPLPPLFRHRINDRRPLEQMEGPIAPARVGHSLIKDLVA